MEDPARYGIGHALLPTRGERDILRKDPGELYAKGRWQRNRSGQNRHRWPVPPDLNRLLRHAATASTQGCSRRYRLSRYPDRSDEASRKVVRHRYQGAATT